MSIDVQMCTVHRFSFIHYVNKETRMTYEPYRRMLKKMNLQTTFYFPITFHLPQESFWIRTIK